MRLLAGDNMSFPNTMKPSSNIWSSDLDYMDTSKNWAQSMTDYNKGKWNPKVHDNLKERLTKAGINLRDLVLWNRRRSNSRIDRAKSPPIIKKAGWARRNIRDALVDVIEAIDTVGWLRSKVASHRLQNVDALTAYDVANAQFLARRLLLEKLGFWK